MDRAKNREIPMISQPRLLTDEEIVAIYGGLDNYIRHTLSELEKINLEIKHEV